MGSEEEGEAWSKIVYIQTRVNGGLHIGDGVGQSEGHLLNGSGAGLADVIAGDADGVPEGQVILAVVEADPASEGERKAIEEMGLEEFTEPPPSPGL